MIKVGVVGAKGRMGMAAVEAVKGSDDLHLVAAVDMGVPPTALAQAGAEVIIDFTTPDAVMRTLKSCIGNGIHCVVGTTGFTDERLDQVREWCAEQPSVGVLVAPNFGIGAVLMMRSRPWRRRTSSRPRSSSCTIRTRSTPPRARPCTPRG